MFKTTKAGKKFKRIWPGALLLLTFLFSFLWILGQSDVEAVYTGDPGSTLFYDYSRMVERLNHIEAVSEGKVELQVIGQSNQGRDLYLATAGTGDIPVMIVTQQHGNEPHGTQAVLNLLEDLVTTEDPAMLNILEQLTVHVVPRLNPDGSEPGVFTRRNIDPEAPVRLDEEGRYSLYRQGWDLNRFHAVDWSTHPLSEYEEFALQTGEFGFVQGMTLTGSAEHAGEEGYLIDCGEGEPGDFPAEAAGNLALIAADGDLDLQVENADTAGAVGVVFYQGGADDTDLPRLELAATPAIPALSITGFTASKIIENDDPVTAQIITKTYPENPATEARIFIETVMDIDPLWLIDVHNQGSWISPAGKAVTSAVMWGTHEDVCPEAQEVSKKICVAMADHMEQFEHAEIALYDVVSFQNIASTCTNGYTIAGVASVLLEIWNNYTHPGIAEMLIDDAYEHLLVALLKTADGSLEELDPDRAHDIPSRGCSTTMEVAEALFELSGYLDDEPLEDELPSTGASAGALFLFAGLPAIIAGYRLWSQSSKKTRQ